jgi:V8-like Glu-specific endopeptidase
MITIEYRRVEVRGMRTIAGRRCRGGRRLSGGRVTQVGIGLCAVGGVAALFLFSANSAGSTDRGRTTLPREGRAPIEQLAPAAEAATGRSFSGVAAVGALFTETDGRLGTHFCTASVVDSAAGDLALTAAHCVYGRSGTLAFVPGYARGQTPYGVWQVTQIYTDSAWDAGQDPDHDVAFLRLADAADGVPVENVTGAESLGTSVPAGKLVQVIGYPDDADRPVWCDGVAKGFSVTQLEFDCAGYTMGTSGGPFLIDVDEATGQGTVIGVIGGYQQGGDTPQVSYAAAFGSPVEVLYTEAKSGSQPDRSLLVGMWRCPVPLGSRDPDSAVAGQDRARAA